MRRAKSIDRDQPRFDLCRDTMGARRTSEVTTARRPGHTPHRFARRMASSSVSERHDRGGIRRPEDPLSLSKGGERLSHLGKDRRLDEISLCVETFFGRLPPATRRAPSLVCRARNIMLGLGELFGPTSAARYGAARGRSGNADSGWARAAALAILSRNESVDRPLDEKTVEPSEQDWSAWSNGRRIASRPPERARYPHRQR